MFTCNCPISGSDWITACKCFTFMSRLCSEECPPLTTGHILSCLAFLLQRIQIYSISKVILLKRIIIKSGLLRIHQPCLFWCEGNMVLKCILIVLNSSRFHHFSLVNEIQQHYKHQWNSISNFQRVQSNESYQYRIQVFLVLIAIQLPVANFEIFKSC